MAHDIIYKKYSYGNRAADQEVEEKKILCTTIMLSIDGQFMLKEAVTSASSHRIRTNGTTK